MPFVCVVPYGQHRTGRHPDDPIGHATQQELGHGAPAVRPHHDEIDVLVARVRDDGLRRAHRCCHNLNGTGTVVVSGDERMKASPDVSLEIERHRGGIEISAAHRRHFTDRHDGRYGMQHVQSTAASTHKLTGVLERKCRSRTEIGRHEYPHRPFRSKAGAMCGICSAMPDRRGAASPAGTNDLAGGAEGIRAKYGKKAGQKAGRRALSAPPGAEPGRGTPFAQFCVEGLP